MTECPNCGGFNVRCYNESYPESWHYCYDCKNDWMEMADIELWDDGNFDDLLARQNGGENPPALT